MLLRQPALALAWMVIGQQIRCAGVPAGVQSVAELDAHARILRDVANVAGFGSVLGDEPELIPDASVTHGSAAGLSGLAADGFQERVSRRGNPQNKKQLVGGIQNKLLKQMNNAVFHFLFLLRKPEISAVDSLSGTIGTG